MMDCASSAAIVACPKWRFPLTKSSSPKWGADLMAGTDNVNTTKNKVIDGLTLGNQSNNFVTSRESGNMVIHPTDSRDFL